MVSYYGRKVASDTDSGLAYGGTPSNNQVFSVFGAMPENGWGHTMYLNAGKLSGSSPTGKLAIAATDGSSHPSTRMAYTGTITFSGTATSGTDAPQVSAAIASVNSTYGPTNAAVMLKAGKVYALGFAVTVNTLLFAMIQASNPNNHYADNYFYYRSVSSTTPSDPIGYTSTSYEGTLAIAIGYDPNVAPGIPSSRTPLGTITTLNPDMTSIFSDGNSSRGDRVKQVAIQVRPVGSSTLKVDGTYSATPAEQSSGNLLISYSALGGQALVAGTQYECRMRHSDLHDAWSSWSDWTNQRFTVNAGGVVGTPSSPTGKQTSSTPGPFTASWSHASALSTNAVEVRILQGGTPVKTMTAMLAQTVANGGSISLTWAQTGFTGSLTNGVYYQYQIRGRDTTGLVSDWSPAQSFNVNAYPNKPSPVSPLTANAPFTTAPKITVKTLDPDGDPITVSLRITTAADILLQTRAMVLRAGTADTWDYQTLFGVSEVQRLSKTSGTITGGSLTLTIAATSLGAGGTTAAILWNDTAATVQTRLQAIPAIGSGNVLVTGGPLDTTPFSFAFQGALAGMDIPQITYASSLTGTTPVISTSTTTAGGGNDLPGYGGYKYYATASDASLTSAASTTQSFTIGQGPVVTVTYPLAASVIPTSTPTITWTATGQVSYAVLITLAGTSVSVYDTRTITGGMIASALQSHAVPAGYLHNNIAYDVTVFVTNATPLTGSNQPQTFTVTYTALSPNAGFTASAYALAGEAKASAVLLSWGDAPEPPSAFKEWVLKRRDLGAPAGDPSEIILRRLSSINQLAFVDYLPQSDKPYTYGLIRSVYNGSDQVDSVEATYDAMVSFDGTIICSASQGGDYRAVLRIMKSNKVNHKDNINYFMAWGDGQPLGVMDQTDYAVVSGIYRLLNGPYGNPLDLMDSLLALKERQILGDVLCLRDNKRRKIFGLLSLGETDVELLRTEADITFTETNAKEGQD
jgi:hypothetical protein